MKLRQGRTRSILEGAIDSALLAVEIYNKPRTTFRSEGYITLMVIAWTKLLHAHFHGTIGDKYYYRKKNRRYERIDGERKAWELSTCVRRCQRLRPAVAANLHFFVGLRNKIEHRHIERGEVDTLIFGECQSLLYNFESTLTELFGEEHSLNENLVYALQFSQMRTTEQKQANKKILSTEMRQVREYVEKYRTSLPAEVFNSQEYSIKLLQIPKIANTNRSDLAVEFVRWSDLSEEDRAEYEKVVAIIKDTVVKREVVNVGRLKPGDVIREVRERSEIDFNQFDHRCFYFVFSARPTTAEGRDPFETNPEFCHYDEVHNDYVYQDEWVEFIVSALQRHAMDKEYFRDLFRKGQKLESTKYRPVAAAQPGKGG